MANVNESILPDDAIFESLLRVPVESLLRFREELKSWSELLSSKFFENSRLQLSKLRPALLFTIDHSLFTRELWKNIGDQDSKLINMDFLFDVVDKTDPFRIVGCYNGLLCLAFLRNDSVIICNPATKKFRCLPNCDFWADYGFGYDPCNSDYKVVRFESEANQEVEIYSLKSGAWKTCHWPYGEVIDEPGVYVDGVIHWMVWSNNDENGWEVVGQNMASDMCTIIPLPPCAKEFKADSVFLGQSVGKLSICFVEEEIMHVWTYGEDSWTALASVSCSFGINELHYVNSEEELLVISENGAIVLKHAYLQFVRSKESVWANSADVQLEGTLYTQSFISP